MRLTTHLDEESAIRRSGTGTTVPDDSGTANDTLAVVVAGFVATDEQWTQFECNWNDSLRQFRISHFHMKEFAHSVGEFSRFRQAKEERESFLRQLLSHIKLRVTYTVAHAVLMNDYRKVNEIYALDYGFPPYALAGRSCVARINLWAEKHGIPKQQIRHVFEDGSAGKTKLYESALRDHGIHVTFMEKGECAALQAADLLAYEALATNRAIFEKGITEFEKLRYPIRQLESLIRDSYDFGSYTVKDLENFCVNAPIPRRDSLVAKTVV
jgi:hypothetical protein